MDSEKIDTDDNDESKKGSDAVHKLAMKRWKLAYDADLENLNDAWDDLKFAGDNQQWDANDVAQRQSENRPCLTLNQIPRFLRQVTGDIRMSKPGIKVIPVDDDTDPQTAEIYESIIRNIEGNSDARAAYFAGVDSQVTAGLGHWRVVADYCSDDTFDQDLKIIPVKNGLGVLWDPAAERSTREDADYCFVLREMLKDEFKSEYPDASPESLDSTDQKGDYWFGTETVRIAEYWMKVDVKRTLALLDDGKTVEITKGNAAEYAGRITKQVERKSHKVVRYVISGKEILEGPDEWVGRFIPIVPVVGEEIQLEKRTVRKGLVRNAKDAQRLYNYWRTAQTEFVALQPKVPFIGTHKNFQDNQSDWENANKVPLPYLAYEPDPVNGGRAPERAMPPVNSTGFDAGVAFAVEDLKATTGLYDASLGQRSNETSGKAIMARQREGDVSTYVYFDNFARAVAYTGRILVDLIPHYYDTARVIRVMGKDGTENRVKVNQPGEMGETMFDLTNGKYDVIMDQGPSYTTAREEAREGMIAFMQALGPESAAVLGDLFARMQDWPYADEIAERIKALQPKPPDPNQPPPEMQAAQAQLEMQMQAKQAETQLNLQAKQQEMALNLEAKAREISMQLEAKQQEMMLAMHAKRGEQEMQNEVASDGERQIADANGTTALAEALSTIVASAQQTNEAVSQAMAIVAQSLAAPKRVVRDAGGNVVGVEVVQ